LLIYYISKGGKILKELIRGKVNKIYLSEIHTLLNLKENVMIVSSDILKPEDFH
jgi:hypothetical protein